MTCGAEQPPFCHFDAERRRNLVRRSCVCRPNHVVYADVHLPHTAPAVCHHLDLMPVLALLGIADSSAAFGFGMTTTIEQGDLESFSTNCKDRRLEIKLRDPKTAFANPPDAPAAEGPASYSPAHALCVPFRSMKWSCRERNGRIEWRFRCRSSCPKSAR